VLQQRPVPAQGRMPQPVQVPRRQELEQQQVQQKV
jgi:hypothetical protein